MPLVEDSTFEEATGASGALSDEAVHEFVIKRLKNSYLGQVHGNLKHRAANFLTAFPTLTSTD